MAETLTWRRLLASRPSQRRFPIVKGKVSSKLFSVKHISEILLLETSLKYYYIRFTWQDFGNRGATGVASVRRCYKLPLCWTKPVPAGSKKDLQLAKAESISGTGSISVVTCLRRGKNCCTTASRREKWV